MMPNDNDKIDQLLAGNYLSGPAYDRVFERVVTQTKAKSDSTQTGVSDSPFGGRPRWLAWTALPFAAAALTLGGWLLIASPGQDQHFAAKGQRASRVAQIDLGCGATGSRTCHIGDTLMFNVNTALTTGYLGAYAERIDDQSGARIWYFRPGQRNAPVVSPGGGTAVLPVGIAIGSEHRLGRYRVTAWLAERPVERLEADDIASGTVSVVAIEFDIVP